MKHVTRAMLAAVLFAQTTSLAAQSLTVVAYEWPPFSGAALPQKGMSLDVISAVMTRAGYEIETQVLPWPRIMSGAREGQYDVIGSLFYDPSLEENLTYSAPFYATNIRLVRKTGSDISYSTVAALQPYSIAVGDGFLYQTEFDHADDLNKVVVTTSLQAIQMVAFGRTDLTLDSVDVVNYALRAEDPSLQDQVEFAPGVLAAQNIHMAVRNDLPDRDKVIADFNKTLMDMRRDGSLATLLYQHM